MRYKDITDKYNNPKKYKIKKQEYYIDDDGNQYNVDNKYVILNPKDASGNEMTVAGLVECVTVKDGKAYLSVDGQYYSYEDFDTVVDLNYIASLVGQDKNETGGTDQENAGNDNNTTTE